MSCLHHSTTWFTPLNTVKFSSLIAPLYILFPSVLFEPSASLTKCLLIRPSLRQRYRLPSRLQISGLSGQLREGPVSTIFLGKSALFSLALAWLVNHSLTQARSVLSSWLTVHVQSFTKSFHYLNISCTLCILVQAPIRLPRGPLS